MNEEVLKLEHQLRKYNDAYREGNPLISDKEYDEIVDRLKKIAPESHWFNKGIQDKVSEDRKEKLPIPMFSLEKVKSHEEIVKWIKSIGLQPLDELIVTPKYDGISLCVFEGVGDVWTRGDGEYGQRCADHFVPMKNSDIQWKSLDQELPDFSFGEAIFKTTDFLKIKEKANYKSARNAVAGLVNSPEVNVEYLRYVSYVRYGCANFGGENESWDKKKQLEVLNEMSLESNRVAFSMITVRSLEDKEGFISLMNSLFEKLTREYKCDGLVIDVNDAQKRKELGRLPNNNPKYAIAYKNPEWSEREETIVREVHWQISKDGRLAPVVEIEPIDLCGATVSRCTAYNARYIVENNIVPGAKVVICRSGDVIPKHLKTISYDRSLPKVPEVCPICGGELVQDANGVDLVCTNAFCEGILLSKCVYFFSTLDFKEFREPTIKKIFNAGYKTVVDMLNIDEKGLSQIEGLGKVAVKVILSQFEELKKKGTNFTKLLVAFNAFGGVIAEKTCQKILNALNLRTEEQVIDFCMKTSRCNYEQYMEQLLQIENIGEASARAFLEGLWDWMSYPISYGKDLIPITFYGLEEKSFDGQMTVVFTGFRNKDWEKKLIDAGHKIGSSVSKKTTCLVVKERGSGSTKEQKAESLGIPIFTMSEFKDKFTL